MSRLHKNKHTKDFFLISLIYCPLITALFFSGCQKFTPMPLNEQTVGKALAVPSNQTLRINAASLKHPSIPPITLNLADGLSPDEAAVLAILINPSLRLQRDRRNIAAGQLIQAGLLPNPQIEMSNDIVTGGDTQGTVKGYLYGLNWDVADLISRSARINAAKKNKAQVVLDVAWQEWQFAVAAKTAVYDLFSLRSQLALAVESDQRLKDNLGIVQKAVQAGLMTELDISAAETASHQMHSIVLELQKQVSEQSLTLNQALGLSADANTVLQNDIELPDSMEIPTADKLLNELEKRRLDLVALRFGYESQQENLRAAVLEQFPKINIGFNNARDTGNVITNGFGVTIDLPVFNQNQGQIAIEHATRQQLFDEYAERVFEARYAITKLSADIPLIIDQIKTAQATISSSKRLVETYRNAIEKEQADVLSYYTAWNDLIQKQIEIIKLKQQLIDTRIALELAVGLYSLNENKAPVNEPAGTENKEATK
jgi:outer membrane protein TolC